MNATGLITTLVSFLVTINMFSQNNNVTVFSNHNEETFTKEYIVYDNAESIALSKSIYQYDGSGNRMSKTSYIWNAEKGWIGSQLYEYGYNNDNQLSIIVYNNWDKLNNRWNKAEDITHIDRDDKLLAEKQIK